MKSPALSYDTEAKALYIRFSDHEVAETIELSRSTYLDVDENGDPVGFEILHADPGLLAVLPTLPNTATLVDLIKRNAA